jgi:hypothetical protein
MADTDRSYYLEREPTVPSSLDQWHVKQEAGSGNTRIIGTVTRRSGGGFIASVPVMKRVNRSWMRVGDAFGRGSDPQAALNDAMLRAAEREEELAKEVVA